MKCCVCCQFGKQSCIFDLILLEAQFCCCLCACGSVLLKDMWGWSFYSKLSEVKVGNLEKLVRLDVLQLFSARKISGKRKKVLGATIEDFDLFQLFAGIFERLLEGPADQPHF